LEDFEPGEHLRNKDSAATGARQGASIVAKHPVYFPETRPSEVPKLLDTEMVKVFQDAAA